MSKLREKVVGRSDESETDEKKLKYVVFGIENKIESGY